MNTKREKTPILRNYVLPIFICLLLAVFVWLSVMKIGYTKEFDGVPVTVTGLDGERFELKAAGTVDDVCFRGNKSTFYNVKNKDIKAYADVSALTESGVYEVALTFSTPSDIELEEPVYFTVELIAK